MCFASRFNIFDEVDDAFLVWNGNTSEFVEKRGNTYMHTALIYGLYLFEINLL